jgi:hypothetical protein
MVKGRFTPTKKQEVILVYCEGREDSAFIKYLHILFHRKNKDPKIKTVSGWGGTADGIVKEASLFFGDYSCRVAIIDNDKPKKEIDRADEEAQKRNIKLIKNTPCLECLLLKILDKEDEISLTSSRICKRNFENLYFQNKSRTSMNDYGAVFPKKVLNLKYKEIPELKILVDLVRGIR